MHKGIYGEWLGDDDAFLCSRIRDEILHPTISTPKARLTKTYILFVMLFTNSHDDKDSCVIKSSESPV